MKRMLIDDTQPEETRVVIVDGNKIEDVEFESSFRKQIKGNIFTAKVIRIEPSLQACFIDYGGNRHGFLAFGEIHPDYYNVSDEIKQEVEKEVDEIIERKRQYQLERQAERERRRIEREQKRAEYEARMKAEAEAEALRLAENNENGLSDDKDYLSCDCGCDENCQCRDENGVCTCLENECHCECKNLEDDSESISDNNDIEGIETSDNLYIEAEIIETSAEDEVTEENKNENHQHKPRHRGNRFLGRRNNKNGVKNKKNKVMLSDDGIEDESITEDVEDDNNFDDEKLYDNDNECDDEVCDVEDTEHYLEIQRKLIYARKLYHRSSIQDVIKEGQTVLVQVVKEERGNKGAACTTYLSLAGRYCVLMPNRIKSGGVSRKITNANDRKRLKDLIKELPLNDDMSMIIRTAGEDKKREDIIRDYNYLIRTWNHIRHSALSMKVPSIIYEEGNLIKRALRDMYTKDIGEVIIDGDEAYRMAKDFSKILSPNMSEKIKCRKPNEIPVFQHYQVEKELDKLHNPIVQLASGGYLVINPTEALVAIDVNSGRATHEMDIEETALKTNLEAADEIARQLKLRNLAGLIVIDFIDMDEASNNHAVEKRMKEALKSDRSRIQVAKMSIFGLLEISRQRMHSSFVESNYTTCPYCKGQGVQRTTESGANLILRALEEEGIKKAYNHIEAKLPYDTAIYLLNHKRRILADLEERYNMEIVISAENQIRSISDYKFEKTKVVKEIKEVVAATSAYEHASARNDTVDEVESFESTDIDEQSDYRPKSRRRFDRRSKSRMRGRRDANKDAKRNSNNFETADEVKNFEPEEVSKPQEEKKTWWKKLIG